MPRNPRRYDLEYKDYGSKPEVRKQNNENKKARRLAEKAGIVKKGDGKDVSHINNKTSDNRLSNLKAQSPSKNRSFPRNKNAGRKK